MATTAASVAELCLRARDAARVLAATDTATKDRALHAIADALEARAPEILEANARDLEAGRENRLSDALMDRLRLDAAALCLKSGNAIVLRGSSSAAHSNAVVAAVAGEAASEAGLPEGAVTLV